MKFRKTVFFLVLMALVAGSVVFGGCQETNQANDLQDVHEILDRRIGKIQSLGGFRTKNQATHLLQLEDGTTILLKSATVDFDSSKYADRTVEISGVLNFKTDLKQLMDVKSIDVLDEIPVQKTAATAWQDYTNVKTGLSLRYRDDFKLTEEDNTVRFAKDVAVTGNSQKTDSVATAKVADRVDKKIQSPPLPVPPPLQHLITISLVPHKEGTGLLQYLQIRSDSATDVLTAGFLKSKLGSGNYNAYKKTSADGKNIDFYLEKNGKIYHLLYVGGDDEQSLADQNLFYDMLATFTLS